MQERGCGDTYVCKHVRSALTFQKAVRVGDVVEFHSVADKYKDTFIRDDTYTLIQRLHHNVIKTGLRKINLSYSRIYLSDVCEKLHLESIEDAEYIVAKVFFCIYTCCMYRLLSIYVTSTFPRSLILDSRT